jgi:N-methylhydantoinase B
MQGYDGTVEEGDIFLTSDPYSVNGAISHANDWLMLMPVYRGGRIIAWSAMFGHMTDVGGKVPGSLPTDGTTIYEDGIVVPPTKIFKAGKLNEDVLRVVLHNCRLPEWNLSDFNAITAALRTAAARCVEIAERFGDDVFYSAMDAMLERNKRAMRALIRQNVPETKQFFEDYICDDGLNMGPYRIKCAMWREGDKCIFDFTGTDPQSISSINFLLNEEMFKMFAGIYMIMVFDPQILFNDGFYDLMEVRIPPGSLLKPLKPAALSCRTHALGRIFDILAGLLGQGNPDFMCGAGFSDSPHFMYSGYDKNGEWYQLYQITFGGIPGKPFGDGPDGHSLWPSFTNVPNEFLESYFPLRIDIYETIADTGGAGKNRGGNGLRIGYRFLEPGEISIHDDRWLTYPWGANGGEPGARSRKLLQRADGTEALLPSKIDHVKVEAGDLLIADTWGGGGWGDPLERATDQVAFDVAAGLVTVDGARRYGVVITKSGEVEAGATEALRAEMRAKRGPKKIFDRGFESIEELKARCKAETGFEPPRTPVFTKWAKVAAEALLAKELAGKKLAAKTLVTKKKRRKAA